MVTPSSGVDLTFGSGSFLSFKSVLNPVQNIAGWSPIPVCQGKLSDGEVTACTYSLEGTGVYTLQITHSKISKSLANKIQQFYFFGNQGSTVPVDRNFYLQVTYIIFNMSKLVINEKNVRNHSRN
jgi:hypothetical protein